MQICILTINKISAATFSKDLFSLEVQEMGLSHVSNMQSTKWTSR